VTVGFVETAADRSLLASPQLRDLIPSPCTDTCPPSYPKIDLGYDRDLNRVLECIEETSDWSGETPTWSYNNCRAVHIRFGRASAITYGVFGIWGTWVHLALMEGILNEPIGVLGLSISLQDYAIARSLMETLPEMDVPVPVLWEDADVAEMGIDVYMAIARTCHHHAAKVLQRHPESQDLHNNGRELAKYFDWKKFFSGADVPKSD